MARFVEDYDCPVNGPYYPNAYLGGHAAGFGRDRRGIRTYSRCQHCGQEISRYEAFRAWRTTMYIIEEEPV